MKFARRNRSVSKARSEKALRSRKFSPNIETLEPRVLLAATISTTVDHSTMLVKDGSTAMIEYRGLTGEAVKNQFVLTSAAANAATLMQQLNARGLHVSALRSLGGNYYQMVNAWDTAAGLGWFASKNPNLITTISPNFVFRKLTSGTATSPLWPNELTDTTNLNAPLIYPYHLNTIGAARAGQPDAWNLSTGSHNTIVAVLDTGVQNINFTGGAGGNNPAHPELVHTVWINPGDFTQDLVDNDGNGVVDDTYGANFTAVDATTGLILADNFFEDNDGHGTYVSGIIAGAANNYFLSTVTVGNTTYERYNDTMVGINWDVRILPVKVLDDTGAGTAASIIAGLNYVQYMKQIAGVNITVANLSLGGHFEGPQTGTSVSDVSNMTIAAQALANAGVILTISAGNDGLSNDIFPVAPANAKNKLIVKVASTDFNDNLSAFSNFGSLVNIAAPGESIFSTISQNSAFTDLTAPTPPFPTGAPHTPLSWDGYSLQSGTSASAPMVAGAVALLKSFMPGASPSQIIDALYAGVDVLPQLQGFVTTSGRLNVFRSAQILLGNKAAVAGVDIASGKRVAGYAFDPNLGSAPVQGTVVVDGVAIPFTADTLRTDVGKFYNGNYHGFNVVLPNLGPGKHSIKVWIADANQVAGRVVNADGSWNLTPRLVYSNIVEGNLLPYGAVENVSNTAIRGWAFDPNLGAGPTNVRIDVDGVTVGFVLASESRPALVNVVGSANHGFTFSFPSTLSPGLHTVKAYALDDFSGQAVFLGSNNFFFNRNLIWNVQSANGHLTGFVYDLDNLDESISLQLVIDGATQFLPDEANLPSAIVESRLGPDVNSDHGFDITLPAFSVGPHTVQLYGYDASTGTRTLLNYTSPGLQGPVGDFDENQITSQTITGVVYDPDTLTTAAGYRLDFINPLTNTVFTYFVGTAALARPELNLGAGNNNHGFSITIPYLPTQLQPNISVAGYNVNLYAVDTTSLHPSLVGAGFYLPTPTADNDIPWGTVEQASAIRVVGYAADTSDLTQAATIEVLVDGAVFFTGPTDVDRPDLAQTPNVGNLAPHGFNVPLGLAAGRHRVDVRVIDLTDPTVHSNIFTRIIDVGVPTGTINVNGAGVLTGIVRGPANVAQPKFRLDYDGIPGLPFNGAAAGAAFNYTAFPPIGARAVVLYYIDQVNAVEVQLATRNLTGAVGNQRVVGAIEQASGVNNISGYVYDPDDLTNPVSYRLVIDNVTTFISDVASGLRNDLGLGVGNSNHGFVVPTPTLAAGGHSVALYGYDTTTKQEVLLASRTFSVVNGSNLLPKGSVEQLNTTHVSGWAADPTSPNVEATVEVSVDGVVVSSAATDISRPDLAAVPGVGNTVPHGFDVALTLTPGVHKIDVRVIDTTTNTTKVILKSALVEAGDNPTAGLISYATYEALSGFTRGPANDPAPMFRLDFNDIPGIPFAGLANGATGDFNVTPPPLRGSVNTVKLYYIDTIYNRVVLLKQASIGPAAAPVANFEAANSSVVAGWVYSPSLPNASMKVQIVLNGIAIGVVTTDVDRPGLQSNVGAGNSTVHGFQFFMPPLQKGNYLVQVNYLDPVTGNYFFGGTRSFIVA